MNTVHMHACVVLMFVAIAANSAHAQTSLTLAGALERAQEFHPSLKAAEAAIDREEGKFKQNIFLSNPQFILSYEDNPRGVSPGTANRKIGIEQTIDFPAKYVLRGMVFSNEIERAQFEKSFAERLVVARVKQLYFTTLAKKSALAFGDSAVRITKEFSAKAKRRRELGAANAIEPVLAQIEEANTERLRLTLESEYRSSLTELSSVLGIAHEEEIILLDSLPGPQKNFSLSELEGRALSSHPSLRSSEASVNASAKALTLAALSPLPDFSVGYAQQTLNGIDKFYSLYLTASVPLFSILNDYGKVEEAAAEKKMREAKLEQTRQELLSSLRSSFARYEAAKKSHGLYSQTLVPQANEAYRIAQRSFEAGEMAYYEFLLAQRTLNETRINFINSLLDLNQSFVDLEFTTGCQL